MNIRNRSRRDRDRGLAGPVILAGMTLAYVAFAQYIVILNDPVALGAGFWPATGLTLGALLLLPTHRWAWVIGGVVAGEFGSNFIHGYPVVANVFWTMGNCVGPLVGAWLLRRYAGFTRQLIPVPNLLAFFFIGVFAGPLVGATIGTLGSVVGVGKPFWQVWPMYVVGDSLGALVVAPVLLTWNTVRIPRRSLESTLLVVGLVAVNTIAFRNWPGAWDVIAPYLIVPILTWAALRYGVRGAALSIFFTANVANVATAYGYGPFAMFGGDIGQAITLLQVFLLIMASVTLVLAALVNDLVKHSQAEAVLKNQALHDSLTGLYNRRALDKALANAMERATRKSAALSVIMFDIDHFKASNDRYGHAVGDNILRQLAEVVATQLRDEDTLARWGGEEFMVVLPDQDLQGAASLAERIRRAVENARVDGPGRISVSVGATAYRPRETPSELCDRVDSAVYAAKNKGRNVVVVT